jgi:iron(III) transport system substrate-binding protein
MSRRAAAVLAPVALLVSACGGGSSDATSSSSTSGSTDASVVSSSAGTVNWQTDWTIDQAEAYIKVFNKAYPNIKVKYTRSDDAAFVDKFAVEAATGNVSEDVITVGYDGYAKDWDAKGYLLHYTSPEGTTYPAADIGADSSYYVNAQLATGICVNTDVLKAKNLPTPTTWEDLAKPVYKGQIVMQDIAAVGSGANAWPINMKGYWSKDGTDSAGDTRYETYFKALGANDVTMQPSYTEAQQQLVSGNFAVMPICYPDYLQPSVDKGAPVKWIAADPIISVFYAQAITAKTKNPEAAKAFQDFSLSETGQTSLATIVGQVPSRPGVAYPSISKAAQGVPTYAALDTPWSSNENTCCIQAYTTQIKSWFGIQ